MDKRLAKLDFEAGAVADAEELLAAKNPDFDA